MTEPDRREGLFREEALRATSQVREGGPVALARPLSFTVFTIFALCVVVTIAGFLLFGEYSRKARVVGYLVPELGNIKVTSPITGTISDVFVRDDSAVRNGAAVLTLSSELAVGSGIMPRELIGAKIQERVRSLRDSIDTLRGNATRREAALKERLRISNDELHQIDTELRGLTRRAQSAADQLAKYKDLGARGFATEVSVQQKFDDFLEQQAKLDALERTKLSIGRVVAETQADLLDVAPKLAQEVDAVRRAISEVEQQSTENETRRRLTIQAPADGTVAAMLHRSGASVREGETLFSLIPKNARLQAHLFIPSRAAGFVDPGQSVVLRYQAFPYQKFGQFKGRILTVSRTAFQPSEVPSAIPGVTDSREAFYRAVVEIDDTAVNAYGRTYPLQAGMLLEADLVQDRRRLVEWAFEPLYSLHGRL